MMDDEARQAHFVIGMALFICVLILAFTYFTSPPVQVRLLSAEGKPDVSSETTTSSFVATSAEASEITSADSVGKINLNTATAEQLETLPGIGPALAERILAYREAYGPFTAVEDLLRVSGIGEKTLESIRDYIAVTK